MLFKNQGLFSPDSICFRKARKIELCKRKPNHNALIIGVKILLIILEYSRESLKSISDYIFRFEILLKKSKFFTTLHMNDKLI